MSKSRVDPSSRMPVVLHFGTMHIYVTCNFSVIGDIMSFSAPRLSPVYPTAPEAPPPRSKEQR